MGRAGFVDGGCGSGVRRELGGGYALVQARWWHAAVELSPPSGRYLSFEEREDLALYRAQGFGVRDIAPCLGRAASTISQELRRNASVRHGTLTYRASTAQWKAERAARRPKVAKLARSPALRAYVEERLAGEVRALGGTPVDGPNVAWIGRRHGRRTDRRWGRAWSPEQIAHRPTGGQWKSPLVAMGTRHGRPRVLPG